MSHYGQREATFQSRIGKQPPPRDQLAAAYLEAGIGAGYEVETRRRAKQRSADRATTAKALKGWRSKREKPNPAPARGRLVRAYARYRARFGTVAP